MRLLPPGRCPFCRYAQSILRIKRGDGITVEKLVCTRCMDVAKMMRSLAGHQNPTDVPTSAE